MLTRAAQTAMVVITVLTVHWNLLIALRFAVALLRMIILQFAFDSSIDFGQVISYYSYNSACSGKCVPGTDLAIGQCSFTVAGTSIWNSPTRRVQHEWLNWSSRGGGSPKFCKC